MSLNHFVDAAVDKAAQAAKMKVKSMLGGGSGGKQPNTSGGGMGGLFPSAGGSGDSGKPKKGGLFGGLLSTQQDDMVPGAGGAGANPGANAGGGAGNLDFNSAVDELAGF